MFKAMATNHIRGSQQLVQPNNKFSTSLNFTVHENLIFRRTVYKEVTDIYIYMYTNIHTYMHSYVRTYIHTYIHTRTYVRAYIHTYRQTHIYIYIYIYLSLCFQVHKKHFYLKIT